MKVHFHTKASDASTDTIIEAKSAWQNFLKGRMGKGKSLKELSAEFKKLKADGKIDDQGNVTESSYVESSKDLVKRLNTMAGKYSGEIKDLLKLAANEIRDLSEKVDELSK